MKTVYWLPCNCGQKVPVTATLAGALVRCTCGAELAVPALREMSRLEAAANGESALNRLAKPAWDKRRAGILFGAVVVAFCGVLLVYLEIVQPRPPHVESLAPIQVWYVWQNLRRGPDRHLAPVEKEFLDNLRMVRMAKTGVLACAAIGLLMIALFYALPPPRTSRRTVRSRTTASVFLHEKTADASQ
ncbi:MAG: hypothetical protein GXY25_11630 [Pirellulaceae bacterium]|jgi:hypothetical protein|nr:hypothetical protein [Pirellulaceae bacterium]